MRYKHYPHIPRRKLNEPLPKINPQFLKSHVRPLDPVMPEPDTTIKGFKPASFWK